MQVFLAVRSGRKRQRGAAGPVQVLRLAAEPPGQQGGPGVRGLCSVSRQQQRASAQERPGAATAASCTLRVCAPGQTETSARRTSGPGLRLRAVPRGRAATRAPAPAYGEPADMPRSPPPRQARLPLPPQK